ncbi:MAG: hypothetical protein P8O69_03800 [Amylibacter sp.]|nr:hypothetical protein [Amylibacter sp.]
MLTIENLEGNNDLYYKYAGSLLFHQFSGIYPDLDQRNIQKTTGAAAPTTWKVHHSNRNSQPNWAKLALLIFVLLTPFYGL